MRGIHIIAVVVLVLINLVLAYANVYYKTPPPDKVLRKTPSGPDISFPPLKTAERRAEMPSIAALWEKNLFSSSRGESHADNPNIPVNRGDLELVGICRLGDTAVAIILTKNQASQKAATPVGSSTKNSAFSIGERHYYKQGQRLSNGFILKEVLSDSVLLSRGNEEIALKIDFKSPERERRIAASTVQPPTPQEQAAPSTATPPVAAPSPEKTLPEAGQAPRINRRRNQAPASNPSLPTPPPPPPMMKTSDNKPSALQPQNSLQKQNVSKTIIFRNA